MATLSSTLAWQIPWMEEPGGLQSMGSLRVGHSFVQEEQRVNEMNLQEPVEILKVSLES